MLLALNRITVLMKQLGFKPVRSLNRRGFLVAEAWSRPRFKVQGSKFNVQSATSDELRATRELGSRMAPELTCELWVRLRSYESYARAFIYWTFIENVHDFWLRNFSNWEILWFLKRSTKFTIWDDGFLITIFLIVSILLLLDAAKIQVFL